MAALPQEFHANYGDTVTSLAIREILQQVKTCYATVSVEYIDRQIISLRQPWQPELESYTVFVGRHRTVHRLAADNDLPLPDNAKILPFIEALPTALCSYGKHSWTARFPTVDAARTFDAAVAHFRPYCEDVVSDTSLATPDDNLLYANNASAAPPKAPATSKNPPIRNATQPPPSAPRKRPAKGSLHYCWTHGANASHSSDQCRTPKPNHKPEASYAHRMGGSAAGIDISSS